MRTVLRITGLALAVTMPVAAAQHEGHGTSAAPAGVSAEVVSTCIDAQQRSLRVLDAVNQRAELSRQTNSAAEMRAAMADVQRALLEARTELGRCGALEQAAATAAPAAGHVMVMVQTALDPAKLSCSPAIDPTASAKTTYQGKTYYFCSAKDRDEFLTNPAMSLAMMPPKQ